MASLSFTPTRLCSFASRFRPLDSIFGRQTSALQSFFNSLPHFGAIRFAVSPRHSASVVLAQMLGLIGAQLKVLKAIVGLDAVAVMDARTLLNRAKCAFPNYTVLMFPLPLLDFLTDVSEYVNQSGAQRGTLSKSMAFLESSAIAHGVNLMQVRS